MIQNMMDLIQKQATTLREKASFFQNYRFRYSIYAMFMIEANDSINYVAEQRAHNEWTVRRI
jgi:hypothetical protein